MQKKNQISPNTPILGDITDRGPIVKMFKLMCHGHALPNLKLHVWLHCSSSMSSSPPVDWNKNKL